MPRISVLCAFHNRAALVRRTLAGLAAQTERDIEFVILDDASQDDTAAQIGAFLETAGDARFRFIRHARNLGLTRGLIGALAASDSEFVAIHDAGDYSLPERMTLQCAALQSDTGLVVTGSHYLNLVEPTGLGRLRRPDAGRATAASLLRDPCFTHGEVMFRRSAYAAAGGYRAAFRYAQDNDLWLRMIALGRFHTVPQLLYLRCIQFDGISYAPDSFARQSAFFVLGKRLARGQAGAEVLEALQRGTDIFALLPRSDPEVQRVIRRGALRALAFGAAAQARGIAAHVSDPRWRRALAAMAAAATTRPGRTALRLAWRAAGWHRAPAAIGQMRRAEAGQTP
jgi:glycosyltransferase involved in cell wall biosynthesis